MPKDRRRSIRTRDKKDKYDFFGGFKKDYKGGDKRTRRDRKRGGRKLSRRRYDR